MYTFPGPKCVINQRKMILVRITRILQTRIKHKILVREPQGTDYFRDLLVDEAILLKWILDHDVKVWARLACIMIL